MDTTTSSRNSTHANLSLPTNSNPPEPKLTGARKSILPHNNRKSILNHPNIKDDCPICLEKMDLTDREIKLTQCNHLFHEACFNEWGKQYTSLIFKCPMCNQPNTKNAPYWNDSLKSFVFKVTKSELNRPEPVISQAVRFEEESPQPFTVDVALAFSGAPTPAARSVKTQINYPPNSYGMTIITDTTTAMTVIRSKKDNEDNEDNKLDPSAAGFLMIPVVLAENTKSYLKSKIQSFCSAIIGYPTTPAPFKSISMTIAPLENKPNSYVTTFTPGLPIKSVTTLGNTASFIFNLITIGKTKRWMFEQPTEFLKWGEKIRCINFPHRNMDWLPPISSTNTLTQKHSVSETTPTVDAVSTNSEKAGKSKKSPSSNSSDAAPAVPQKMRKIELSTKTPDNASSAIEEPEEDYIVGSTSVDPTPPGWWNWLKLGIRVSCNSDGSNPFATYRGLTFINKSRSGCIANSFIADQINQSNNEYDKYQQDYSNGIKNVDDSDSFFVIIDTATE